MKRLVTQKKKKNVEAYPDELHYFPMTLKFYSAKAYTYVRQGWKMYRTTGPLVSENL